MPSINLDIKADDALQYLIRFLHSYKKSDYGTYGYDFWVPEAVFKYLMENYQLSNHFSAHNKEISIASPPFFDAAWTLCRRGILRPSVAKHGGQGLDNGECYSITVQGREWLAKQGNEHHIPTEPSRFAGFISRFKEQLGDGFYQRAQEAITCHSFGIYLACCAMAGAAAESVLLRLAIAKVGDEDAVLTNYRRGGGRNIIEQQIVSSIKKPMADTFVELTSLIKYWRDEASHGEISEISEFEAYEALARLLRFAHFATDNWERLTAKN